MRAALKKKTYVLLLIFIVISSVLSACVPIVSSTPLITRTQTPTFTPSPLETETNSILTQLTAENIANIQLLYKLGDGKIIDLAVSPDEQKLAVYTATQIHIYSLFTFEEVDAIPVTTSNNYPTDSLCFSPDSQLLAYSELQKVHIYSLMTKKDESSFISSVTDLGISKIEFTKNGNRLVITSEGGTEFCDGAAVNFALFNLNGDLLYNQNACKDPAYGGIYHLTDSKMYLLIGDVNVPDISLNMYIINLDNGFLLATSLVTHGYNNVNSITSSTAGDVNLLPTIEEIKSWFPSIDSYPSRAGFIQKCLNKFQENYDYSIQYDNGKLAIISANNNIEIFNSNTCKLLKNISYTSANSLKVDPTRTLLASSNGADITIWNIETGKELFTIKGTPTYNYVNSLTFNSDGSWFIKGENAGENYYISIWDVQTGNKLYEIQIDNTSWATVAATPQREILLVEDSTGTNIWNLSTGKKLYTLPKGNYLFDSARNSIWISVFDRDKETLQIKSYNLNTGKVLCELPEFFSVDYESSILNSSGNQLAIILLNLKTTQREIITYDAITGSKLWSKIIPRLAKSIDFQDNAITEFDKGNEVTTFLPEEPIRYLSGNLLSRNQTFLITQADNNIYFWDSTNENLLGMIKSNLIFESFFIGEQNRYLASVDENGLIYIWGIKEQ
jgi:WD40 repeat protein